MLKLGTPTYIRSTATRLTLAALVALTGCAPTGADLDPDLEGEEYVDDGEVVEDGKADDFLSLTARELVVSGTDTVELEAEYTGQSDEARMERARQLVALRQVALAWFMNQYLVDKEEDEGNHEYGGFGAMSKSDYDSLAIREVEGNVFAFDFEQIIAGRLDLMTRLPTRPGAEVGTRVFTLTVGVPTNAELERLETNAEWYRDAPWSAWNPTTVAASRRRDLELTLRRETESSDAWLDYARLFEDGTLDIDVHFGWDYHDAYHIQHARSLDAWLRANSYRAPVSDFDQLTRESGPYTRTLRAGGQSIRVEIRIFYGRPGSDVDPDTAAGGRLLETDMRASLATRDVIVYSGHSGPFYGFALANWRMTDEGDLDDSEMSSVEMPADRYQIVLAEGCDTYQIGSAFGRNPAHLDLRGLDVITTTSFSNASTPRTVTDFLSRLMERDSRGEHRPRTIRTMLQDLDNNGGRGFHTMYGIHGIDDAPQVHPFADREMFGQECSRNADCGEIGNLCIRLEDGARRCSAACTADAGCGESMRCRPIASASRRAIYGSACVPD